MSGRRVVLASGNRGKLAEFAELAREQDIELIAQSELGVESPAENGLSFIENALIKARHASAHTGLPALADDSGLCVDALGGAPGLYSARYAGDSASAADNNHKLLQVMAGVAAGRRHAFFFCALAFVRSADDPCPLIAEGLWHGRILEAPRGDAGFGYDPLFFDPLQGQGAAEMSAVTKQALSHRGQALAELRRKLHRL